MQLIFSHKRGHLKSIYVELSRNQTQNQKKFHKESFWRKQWLKKMQNKKQIPESVQNMSQSLNNNKIFDLSLSRKLVCVLTKPCKLGLKNNEKFFVSTVKQNITRPWSDIDDDVIRRS